MLSNFLRIFLSSKSKIAIGEAFPEIYMFYERKFILNTLGLRQFYNKKSNCLHLGKAVLPMDVFCNSELIGVFNTEFSDIVYPMLPSAYNVKKYPFNEGPYELGNVKVNKGDIVFDCGANVGIFSAMTANFDCTCYAFEPLPKNIVYLNKVIHVNPHINLVEAAVCDNDGVVQFEDSEAYSSTTKISLNKNNKNKITVNAITIDSFVNRNKLEHVDFIKADIEGSERLLVKGARYVLKKFAPKLSLCTYHLADDSQVLRELIHDANPNYIIEEKYKKMYAYVPK